MVERRNTGKVFRRVDGTLKRRKYGRCKGKKK